MRVLMTGQVGMDKKQYLEAVVELASGRGERIDLYNVGDMMYAEAPDVRPGRILDLPLSRLNALRRAVFRDIIAGSAGKSDVLVNTHATFRWRHGLFSAFDFDQLHKLEPNMLICLVDNIEVVHHRLHRDHTVDATLKDLMVWREEEIMATELVAQALGCPNNFYILSRGRHRETHESCFHLTCRPHLPKVYPSFPMSHVMDMPEVLAEIKSFRSELALRFNAFDPGEVDEKLLLGHALQAAKEGRDFISTTIGTECTGKRTIDVSVKQVLDIAGDVDGQIYMRDFKLIDQSDMICSYIPQLPGGLPALSSGVERELQHAFEHGKEVYVVWKPSKSPSPFITETATKVFGSTDEALAYFEQRGIPVIA
ncbi:MAG: ATP-binding protein [Pirellulaceae bacterium]|nr:ATP-binding protein [Pirellulaceae bacterium]